MKLFKTHGGVYRDAILARPPGGQSGKSNGPTALRYLLSICRASRRPACFQLITLNGYLPNAEY